MVGRGVITTRPERSLDCSDRVGRSARVKERQELVGPASDGGGQEPQASAVRSDRHSVVGSYPLGADDSSIGAWPTLDVTVHAKVNGVRVGWREPELEIVGSITGVPSVCGQCGVLPKPFA